MRETRGHKESQSPRPSSLPHVASPTSNTDPQKPPTHSREPPGVQGPVQWASALPYTATADSSRRAAAQIHASKFTEQSAHCSPDSDSESAWREYWASLSPVAQSHSPEATINRYFCQFPEASCESRSTEVSIHTVYNTTMGARLEHMPAPCLCRATV